MRALVDKIDQTLRVVDERTDALIDCKLSPGF